MEYTHTYKDINDICMWFAPENTPASRRAQTLYPWRPRVTRGDPWKAFLRALGCAWRLLEPSAAMSSPLALL